MATLMMTTDRLYGVYRYGSELFPSFYYLVFEWIKNYYNLKWKGKEQKFKILQ